MNRTLTAVRNIISALGPLAFDIGVLSERGMLPGLSDLPASTVLDRVPLLKYQNAHGAHIYIRPAGQHRFTVLGDLNREALNTLTADGFEPCAVVETSAGNFQAWLKHAAKCPLHSLHSPRRHLQFAIGQTLMLRSGGASVGFPVSPAASRSIVKKKVIIRLFSCAAVQVSSS
jgi:hypothetical protein